METQKIARDPRPAYHRIPNFARAKVAAIALSQLDVFKEAAKLAVGPDHAQRKVRELTLVDKKVLYVPQPRLEHGFFTEVRRNRVKKMGLSRASLIPKLQQFGAPLQLDDAMKLDLIVIGSVAVHAETGARVGSGDGFAELEYALLRMIGAVDANTPVVTTVHDCQVVDLVKFGRSAEYDVPVDIIVTPTRIIYPESKTPKPDGILWHLLSPQKLGKMKVLRDLKRQIEEETGSLLPLGQDEEPLPSPFDWWRKQGR